MRATVALVLATAALAGCSMKEDMTATDAAVARFHQQLDAGRLDDIVQTSAPEMKASANAAMFGPILAAVHRKLGRTAGTRRLGFNDQQNTAGHFVAVTFHTKFERGEGNESFTFKLDDGHPTLAGYNVNAPALILN